LREEGRIPREVAAAALLDLDSEGEAVVREALVAALAVGCGAARTPSGLVLVG
jgi:predicted cation transporter